MGAHRSGILSLNVSLNRGHSKWVRCRVEHEKRNSISTSNHVLFCLSYKMLATLTDCCLEDIECGKYQLVFALAGNVLFWLNVWVFFFSKDSASSFSFHLCWFITCSFPEMHWSKTNQGVFSFSTASSGRFLLTLLPPTTPTIHSNSISNLQSIQ